MHAWTMVMRMRREYNQGSPGTERRELYHYNGNAVKMMCKYMYKSFQQFCVMVSVLCDGFSFV